MRRPRCRPSHSKPLPLSARALLQSPRSGVRYRWLGIFGQGAEGGMCALQVCRVGFRRCGRQPVGPVPVSRQDVPEGDGRVAAETVVGGPFHAAAPKASGVSGEIHRQQVNKIRNIISLPWEKSARRMGLAPVPWAGGLTVVAPEGPITEVSAVLGRVGSSQLDGVVGNAPPAVHDSGLDDGACRAGLQTEGAGAALVHGRFVGRHLEIIVENGQEDTCPVMVVKLHVFFPDLALPSPGCTHSI